MYDLTIYDLRLGNERESKGRQKVPIIKEKQYWDIKRSHIKLYRELILIVNSKSLNRK